MIRRYVVAIFLGLLLGLFVSAAAYFNDSVIGQTRFVGNFLPISVFGIAVLLLLVCNPLLRAIGPRLVLNGRQMAIITAVGLAACGWPGSNFFRVFGGATAMPAHLIHNEPSWQAAEVLSYVPGGSSRLAPGHVRNWEGLIERLVEADAADPAALAIRSRLDESTRLQLTEAHRTGQADYAARSALLLELNAMIEADDPDDRPPLYADPALADGPDDPRLVEARAALEVRLQRHEERALADPNDDVPALRAAHVREQIERLDERRNRLVLVEAFSLHLVPPPPGTGLLLMGGRTDPFATETLLLARPEGNRLSPAELPWDAWWPVIQTWGGLGLCLALAALGLAGVFHPQWTHRELLQYPIVRFMDEVTRPGETGRLPAIARSRAFWIAFAAIAGVHLVNGLHEWVHVWNDTINTPQIMTKFDFSPVKQLIPEVSRVWGVNRALSPTIYFAVVAFAFFLTSEVALSVGLALYAWIVLGAIMLGRGETLGNHFMGTGEGTMLRAGAYIAVTGTILFIGRRYYLNVLGSAIGLRRRIDTPAYAPWAARLVAVACGLALAILYRAGLNLPAAAMLLALILVAYIAISRIVCETGLFFVHAKWMPIGVMSALFGAEAMGPTPFIVVAMIGMVFVGDTRSTFMPYLATALGMGDRAADTSPRRLGPVLATMLVLGFVTALVVTLYVQHNLGINSNDSWAARVVPSRPLQALESEVADLAARGELVAATQATGLERLAHIDPQLDAVFWLALGAALVVGCAAARLRLPWWPIHPVLFLVWGTYPVAVFHFSFLLGWAIKLAVIKIGGSKAYRAMLPIMVGIIAGELIMGLFWMLAGAVYYFATDGGAPPTYSVFPG